MISPAQLYSKMTFDIQCCLPNNCCHENCFLDDQQTLFKSGNDILNFIYDYALLNNLIVNIPDHFYDMVMRLDKDQKNLHLGPSHFFFDGNSYKIILINK